MVKSNNFAHRNRRERENYLTMVAIAVGGKNVFMRKQCLNPTDFGGQIRLDAEIVVKSNNFAHPTSLKNWPTRHFWWANSVGCGNCGEIL